ncbi:MAG: methionyl-tRNA synthetase [Patescibacteria group bacterium]|nr:methionyl-tRNA synthetase [Patescibacteria group bacterium]
MNKVKPFYITTTLPYVNAEPHIGHALEFVRADVIARYKESVGYDVFFNTGTDEHGTKILEGAEKEGLPVQDYVNKNAARFKELYPKLGIKEGFHFIRTTEEHHMQAAQEMWRICDKNGYIYKKEYEAKYCVGCELYKTDSELEDGKCPIHPNRSIDIIKEENYFFAFSKLEDKLRSLYEHNPELVVPEFRFNEIKAFLERGLEDFSISRLKSKMPWGVPVPGDDDHVMYVWFDALTNYVSTLGWPDGDNYKKYWEQGEQEAREVVQYCGKDNLRQQSAIWQAMLLASGLPHTTSIIINGFIISGGQKMSKSTGNGINPFDILDMFKSVTDYPEDVLRFILLHEVPSFEDGDLTIDSIKTAYTAYLANGIGNLTSRIMRMAITNSVSLSALTRNTKEKENNLEKFDTNVAIKNLMQTMRALDEYIATHEPFKVVKVDQEKGKEMISFCLRGLLDFSNQLEVFLPKTSAKILECIHENKMPEKPLFGRLA